jgi:hypothetical protein
MRRREGRTLGAPALQWGPCRSTRMSREVGPSNAGRTVRTRQDVHAPDQRCGDGLKVCDELVELARLQTVARRCGDVVGERVDPLPGHRPVTEPIGAVDEATGAHPVHNRGQPWPAPMSGIAVGTAAVLRLGVRPPRTYQRGLVGQYALSGHSLSVTSSARASLRYSMRFHTSGTISRHAMRPKSTEPLYENTVMLSAPVTLVTAETG